MQFLTMVPEPAQQHTHFAALAVAGVRPASSGESDANISTSAVRLSAIGRELWSYAKSHKGWVLCTTIFALLWTAELFMVQRFTLVPAQEVGPRLAAWGPFIRFCLDLLFAATMTLLLPRILLVVACIASLTIHLGLLTYFAYFQRPISALTIFNNWWEGAQLSGFAGHLFPRQSLLILFGILALKLVVLYAARRQPMPRALRLPLAGLFATGYFVLSCAAVYLDPLSALQSTRGVGRLGYTHGYAQVWLAELWYLRGNPNLGKSLLPTDRLSPHEANIPIEDHLAIIQAESLDYNVLGLTTNGEEVTPFLNRLRARGMFYRVRAVHNCGSADADFVTINGAAGSPHIVAYNIPGIRFYSPLPEYLERFGYETSFFHGNTGNFYNRRGPLESLNFRQLNFLEELVSQFGLRTSEFGVRDADVLALSALQLHHQRKARICHFVITLTTHSPYLFLRPQDQLLFPKPANAFERYLNNMRYLDDCLRKYIQSLDVPTTVMIYADHPAEPEISSPTFQPARSRRPSFREYIPVFIFDTSQDLMSLQKTRHQAISHDGTLNLIDMTTYLRKQVARAKGVSSAGPSTDEAQEQR